MSVHQQLSHRHVKIVATLGPSSSSPEAIAKLIELGVDVFRLNFSHGKHPDHLLRIQSIRAAAQAAGKHVAILQDIQGPKIRIGEVEGGEVQLVPGQRFSLTSRERIATAEGASVSYDQLEADVPQGATVLLDDGNLELKVLEVKPTEVVTEVVVGGPLRPHKGVNFPGVEMNVEVLTDKDREDLLFGIEHDVDWVAASFVQRPADVLLIKEFLASRGSKAQVISKIERREAVHQIADIAAISDGVMVARGDLGVETAPEEVPMAQKRIIATCNRLGKPVITATQMLDSMIHNPRPTRAEASDVANAVFDGTDAVMLSNESAAGAYPFAAVATMDRIVREAEKALLSQDRTNRTLVPGQAVADAVSLATAQLSDKLEAAAIVVATSGGTSARMVSRYRPRSPIVSMSADERVSRQLALVWGVLPRVIPEPSTDEALVAEAMARIQAEGLVQSGDVVVLTAGTPLGVPGQTNFIKVEIVNNLLARGMGLGHASVHGTARVVASAEEALAQVEKGDILVAPETNRDYVPAMQRAAGVVVEMGGLTSHAAIVCMQLGIPLVLEVGDWKELPDGQIITLDPKRGVIYQGVAKV